MPKVIISQSWAEVVLLFRPFQPLSKDVTFHRGTVSSFMMSAIFWWSHVRLDKRFNFVTTPMFQIDGFNVQGFQHLVDDPPSLVTNQGLVFRLVFVILLFSIFSKTRVWFGLFGVMIFKS